MIQQTMPTEAPQTANLLPCFMVNNLTHSSYEQCKFVIDNDCLEEDSIIDYVHLIFCDLGQEWRFASIVLVVLLVILLFLALSSVADEFLCPSLLTVAKNLRMSDSLAGVTLLAFGNGCPDIFSSLAAASDDRPELIVGELLGAGIFCTSIVSGLIFISSDFKLACRPILRDTTFYLLAVYLIWFYCYSGEITFYKSLAFIIIYIVYLIVALSGQAIHSRLQGNYAIADKQAETGDDREKNGNWFKSREESLRRRQMARMMKDLETKPLTSSERVHSNSDGVTCIHLGSDSMTSTSAPDRLEIKLCPPIRIETTKLDGHGGGHVNGAFVSNEKLNMSNNNNNNNNKPIKQQQVIKLEASTKKQPPPASPAAMMAVAKFNGNDDMILGPSPNDLDDFLAHINPINLVDWHEASLISKLIRILRAPVIFAAIMTVPVIDHDRRLSNWCRSLNVLHCVTVPMSMLILINRFEDTSNLSLLGVPMPFLILIPGLMLALFVLKTTISQQPPKYLAMFAYFGFIMSIMWTYLLATEIISLLKTVGIMFSMTDTAIGLGILAWGNSLGDIVANTTLAQAGYPRMAIGATIGAPLLNLLLGFGLSFSVSLKPGEISIVEYSPTITLLCSTLAIILISLMLITLVPPEKSKRPFGYMLITGYGIYFALAVCLEYGLIKV